MTAPARATCSRRAYANKGMRSSTRPTPRKAAEIALANPPHAVVTDLWMPAISGLQLCRLLSAEPATSCVPIVLLTASDDRRSRFWARCAGATAYVTKTEIGELKRILEEVTKDGETYPPPAAVVRSEPGRIQERLSALLDTALYESTIAGEVRALAHTDGDLQRLFGELVRLASDVVSYRWLAVKATTEGFPVLLLHANAASRAAAEEEAQHSPRHGGGHRGFGDRGRARAHRSTARTTARSRDQVRQSRPRLDRARPQPARGLGRGSQVRGAPRRRARGTAPDGSAHLRSAPPRRDRLADGAHESPRVHGGDGPRALPRGEAHAPLVAPHARRGPLQARQRHPRPRRGRRRAPRDRGRSSGRSRERAISSRAGGARSSSSRSRKRPRREGASPPSACVGRLRKLRSCSRTARSCTRRHRSGSRARPRRSTSTSSSRAPTARSIRRRRADATASSTAERRAPDDRSSRARLFPRSLCGLRVGHLVDRA